MNLGRSRRREQTRDHFNTDRITRQQQQSSRIRLQWLQGSSWGPISYRRLGGEVARVVIEVVVFVVVGRRGRRRRGLAFPFLATRARASYVTAHRPEKPFTSHTISDSRLDCALKVTPATRGVSSGWPRASDWRRREQQHAAEADGETRASTYLTRETTRWPVSTTCLGPLSMGCLY